MKFYKILFNHLKIVKNFIVTSLLSAHAEILRIILFY